MCPFTFFFFVVGKFKKADIFSTCVSKQMNNKNVARKSRDFSAGFTDSSLERLQFDVSCIWSARMRFRVLVRSAVVKQFSKSNFRERTAPLNTGPWLLLDNYSFCWSHQSERVERCHPREPAARRGLPSDWASGCPGMPWRRVRRDHTQTYTRTALRQPAGERERYMF